MPLLTGKIGLVVGIANEHSIAWGCARAFHAEGAVLAVTHLNERAAPHVRPLADQVAAELVLPLDVEVEGQLDAVFDAIAARWGRLDFLLHSIAYCPKDDLHGRVVDCSRAGFLQAMDVSCHSFIRMARRAEPLMRGGGTLMTVTFFGAVKVVPNYNAMGPVKAALESVTRYLAADLGPKRIRVHALSAGPMPTRAASGIAEFDSLVERAAAHSPSGTLAGIDDVGAYAAFLASDNARNVTGSVPYIDGGYNIVG